MIYEVQTDYGPQEIEGDGYTIFDEGLFILNKGKEVATFANGTWAWVALKPEPEQ